MQIRQLINDFEPVRLTVRDSVLDAVRHMVQRRCGSVLVEDSQGAMTGIFTERDLMTRVIAEGLEPGEVSLGEVLTREVYAVGPDDDVTTVRRELRARHIRHVPVLEGSRVLAVLSMRDLLTADFEAHRDSARAMGAYIRGEL